MTKTAFNNALASKSTDVKREEKSPQGFDVIAFRENGNNSSLSGNQYDQKYSTYILAYLQDNEVIGITAIAPGMSYAGEVSYGTPASTLASNGWTSVDWYLAGSAAGAYTKTIKGTEVIAFVDALGSNQVYCIQAFSDSFLVDDMTKVSETTLQLKYPAEVQTAMATESGELLNAYLVNQGQSAFRINTKLSAAAKSYSSEIVSAGIIDAIDASRSSSDIRSSIRAAGIAPGAWGERVLIGNMDAIGFANSMIESSGARALLWSGDYAVMGLGAGAYNDGTVSYGTDAGTLVSNGWVDVDWYKTTAGNAAAYSKDVDNATIIAFADAYGDNRVYSIQIFNNAYSIADMTQCTETTLPMNYSADVLTEMETETFEILNAYLVNTGVRDADVKAIRKNTKVSNVARAYSKEIANKGCIDAANAKRESALSKEALENAGLSFNNWGERIMIGNMDAIGFANSVIESNDARNTLISANYAICGIGASVYTKSAGKAVYYPNMVIVFIDKISLCNLLSNQKKL